LSPRYTLNAGYEGLLIVWEGTKELGRWIPHGASTAATVVWEGTKETGRWIRVNVGPVLGQVGAEAWDGIKWVAVHAGEATVAGLQFTARVASEATQAVVKGAPIVWREGVAAVRKVGPGLKAGALAVWNGVKWLAVSSVDTIVAHAPVAWDGARWAARSIASGVRMGAKVTLKSGTWVVKNGPPLVWVGTKTIGRWVLEGANEAGVAAWNGARWCYFACESAMLGSGRHALEESLKGASLAIAGGAGRRRRRRLLQQIGAGKNTTLHDSDVAVTVWDGAKWLPASALDIAPFGLRPSVGGMLKGGKADSGMVWNGAHWVSKVRLLFAKWKSLGVLVAYVRCRCCCCCCCCCST
jgi:hypothetical protein